MKRMIAAFVAGILTLSMVAGCGSKTSTPTNGNSEKTTESSTPTIDKIKTEGKLLVGTSPDYPPFESLDKDNNVIGFDIDVMNEVANKLGVKLEIVQIGFDGLIGALNAKKFDIMAAGATITPERLKEVDFTIPYIAGNDAVVVNKANSFTVTKLEDLKGKKVAVQIGTVQAEALKKIPGINVKEYNLFTEAAAAVSSKQVDAMYLHETVAKSFMAADKNLEVVFGNPADETAYALRKDTPDLTKYVSDTLTDMKSAGKLDELMKKWFK